jgi:hypothetical protein
LLLLEIFVSSNAKKAIKGKYESYFLSEMIQKDHFLKIQLHFYFKVCMKIPSDFFKNENFLDFQMNKRRVGFVEKRLFI